MKNDRWTARISLKLFISGLVILALTVCYMLLDYALLVSGVSALDIPEAWYVIATCIGWSALLGGLMLDTVARGANLAFLFLGLMLDAVEWHIKHTE